MKKLFAFDGKSTQRNLTVADIQKAQGKKEMTARRIKALRSGRYDSIRPSSYNGNNSPKAAIPTL